ncbi:protein mono-ADP-ribosyltransferase PARP16-like isoform X5 [Hydractinia symbiolongicarpus]|nr:protein mono-ADP-ribosyltransferase PARP16-like isoform X5 [Hydractinia symbiolongicarpus]
MINSIPPLNELKKGNIVLSEEIWQLLHWILKNRLFSAKTCDREVLKDLQEKTGQSSFSLQPDYIFEVCYTTNASQTFEQQSRHYGVKYGYHGSRMDNFYSITSNGLQVHMMKNGLFGDGVYLCEDLAVTMPYVSGGTLWKHSKLGQQASCVAVCEILDHPGVKYQEKSAKNRKRCAAKNTELGEVPEKYFVVTSSDLVRVKYLLLFMDKPTKTRKKGQSSWICFRHPVACVLILYLLLLLLIGLWKSRTVQLYLKRHFKSKSFDDD